MNHFAILLIVLGAGLAHAQTPVTVLDVDQPAPKIKGDWNFALGGISLEEGKDEGAAAAFYGSARLEYGFTDWLKAKLNPRISMFSSRLQERYNDDIFEGRLWLADGYLSAEAGEHLEFRAGTITQRFHGSSMLVSNLRSFPGLQEILKGRVGGIDARLTIQQAIPTSHSYNTERIREEKLPSFNTQTLTLSGKNFGLVEWDASGGLFSWQNIPSKVIWESRRVGNVGIGENASNSQYLHGHKGWFANGEIYVGNGGVLGAVLEYQRIQNTEAPSDSADAQLVGFGPRISWRDYDLDLRYRAFFIESNATIAAYNKSRFGNANREGSNLEARLHFKKQKFTVFGEAYVAEPINIDPNQRDLTIFYFGVETDYATF